MPKGHYDRAAIKQHAPVVPQTADATAPMRLTEPFGFVNEYDATYFKQAGTVISNPLEIAVLIERGASLEAV